MSTALLKLLQLTHNKTPSKAFDPLELFSLLGKKYEGLLQAVNRMYMTICNAHYAIISRLLKSLKLVMMWCTADYSIFLTATSLFIVPIVQAKVRQKLFQYFDADSVKNVYGKFTSYSTFSIQTAWIIALGLKIF